MDSSIIPKLPTPKVLFWKHHFGIQADYGTERYVTLMAVMFPKRAKASLFGTELTPQIDLPCDDLSDACLIAEVKFKQVFPDHRCNDGCSTKWQPLLHDSPASRVQ